MDCPEPAMVDSGPSREDFTFEDVPRLSAGLKRGDEAAFAWLHNAWSGRIRQYCFALAAGDATLAGEIAQATWLRLVRHIRVLESEAALWNWIACGARHAATDLRRTGGRYQRALGRFADWWRPNTETRDAAQDLHAALESALAILSDEERLLIEGRYFNDASLEDIARQIDLTTRAVEGRLARLRVRLRELIAKELLSQRP